MDNGFKSWRTSIGDVDAAARYLATSGIADPKRVAIVGWSYGGYAALQAAATDPALYKGVVANHQLEDSDARTEMLTKIGELLDNTIGH